MSTAETGKASLDGELAAYDTARFALTSWQRCQPDVVTSGRQCNFTTSQIAD